MYNVPSCKLLSVPRLVIFGCAAVFISPLIAVEVNVLNVAVFPVSKLGVLSSLVTVKSARVVGNVMFVVPATFKFLQYKSNSVRNSFYIHGPKTNG